MSFKEYLEGSLNEAKNYKLCAIHNDEDKRIVFIGSYKECENFIKEYNHEQSFKVEYSIEPATSSDKLGEVKGWKRIK
jgi:hypothetical protein